MSNITIGDIIKNPALAQKRGALDGLSPYDWCLILKHQPRLAGMCRAWGSFLKWQWFELLYAQPQFADRCGNYGGWLEFDPCDWRDLLAKHPQFADNCPDRIYDQLSHADWEILEAADPVFTDKHILSSLRKI